MTETCVCVTVPSEHDIVPRAAGSLLPEIAVKLLGEDGKEITGHDQPGEIYVRSPSVVLGYLCNDKANSETFISDDEGRWIRTGDIGLMTKVSSGNEQLVIVDRIKEMIKVMVSLLGSVSNGEGRLQSSLFFRVTKLHRLSSKHIYWRTLQLPIAPSYRSLTLRPEKYQRPLSFNQEPP